MIYLRNPNNNAIVACPTGFSWTNLFFGFFVPLFRGDIKYLIIQLLVAGITAGLSTFIFPFFYNKLYIKSKLDKNFVPNDDYSAAYLMDNGYIYSR